MKFSHLSLVFILIMFITALGVITANAGAERERTASLAEEAKIREVIRNYFDKRYRSRATNLLEDFNGFAGRSPEATSFLNRETEKLEIEIYNAKLHHLRYTQYEYTLDFNDISIDGENHIATVSLVEGHDVVFEISEMIAKMYPIVSKMRNLEHTIILRKNQGGWKIVSDHYDDLLWRMLRASNLSKEDMLLMLDNKQDETLTLGGVKSTTTSCNLPADESTHPYNRSGVVAYARRYATDPNPAYYYFPLPYGDCTNFVNQAIHHGSNAEEVGSNTYGWYYNYYISHQDNDYSASWTDVQFSYDFITKYYVWNRGPEGCEINNDYAALEGDLVQFERVGNIEEWDHAMIIVERQEDPQDPYNPNFYVAGHSDDLDDYPLSSVTYRDIRFIRIERIDGYAKVYLPLLLKVWRPTGEPNGNDTSQYPYPNPYPAPMESIDEPEAISPYPAP